MPKRKAPNLDGQAKPVRDTRVYDAALARPDSPQEQAAREKRLVALCEKHGVPVDLERPLREQLLVKIMWRRRRMWAIDRQPGEDDE